MLKTTAHNAGWRHRPDKYALLSERKETFFPGLKSYQNLTGRVCYGRSKIRTLASSILGELASAAGGASRLRVFELGAGSARLLGHLMKKHGLRPENCVIGDIDYSTANSRIGPMIVKEVHKGTKNGVLKKVYANVFSTPPEGIGKFDLIAVPNVLNNLGRPNIGALENLARNYCGLLKRGGCLVINRILIKDLISLSPIIKQYPDFEFRQYPEENSLVIRKK